MLLERGKNDIFKQIKEKLYYFEGEDKTEPNNSKGFIDLSEITQIVPKSDNKSFELKTPARTYVLQISPDKGKEKEELQYWVDGINNYTKYLKKKSRKCR